MKYSFGAEPSADERFYAQALSILVGPTRRALVVMRLVNLAYWVAVLGALAWLFSQVIDRASPVEVHGATLLTPDIRPGQPLRVRYQFTRRRTCETDVSWSVFDGAQEVTRFGPVHSSAGGRPADEDVVHVWSTPVSAAPGQGRLRVIYAYQCPGNYLHAIYPVTLILPDILFAITDRPHE